MKKNLLALLAGIIVSLIIIETALHIYNPFTFRLKGNTIFLQANRKYVFANNAIDGLDKKVIHTKNSLGFRGDEKPADFNSYLSIIAVGGSTAECYYTSDTKTWADLLKKNLDTDFNKIWLNNAGLDGHSTFGHIVLLNEFIVKLKPRVLLFLVGANDIGRSDLTSDKSNLYSMQPFFKKIAEKSELFFTCINLKRVLMASEFKFNHGMMDLKNTMKLDIQPAEYDKTLAAQDAYVREYKKRLGTIVETCKANNIEPVFITQPCLVGEGIDDASGINLETIKINDTMNGKLFWKILEIYNEATKQVARDNGVMSIDLALKLPKSSKYFYDTFHFTNDGCSLVANILYKEMKAYFSVKYKDFLKTDTR